MNITRWLLGFLATLIGLPFLFVATAFCVLWVVLAEPWYSDEIVQHMVGGPRSAPWRDETHRVAGLFPEGMSRAAAGKFLNTNGFSCEETPNHLACLREKHGFPCLMRYTVRVSFSSDKTMALASAESYAGCL